jgi:phosphate transport system substrate-binding protein
MRLRSFAIAAVAGVAMMAPASAGAVTLIGSGGTAPQPVLEALFRTYTKQVKPSVHFVYTADGGNAGVRDVQTGTSMFAGQGRSPLPSDAGTTYVKLDLDGLCFDVNPKNKLSNITIQQAHDIYRGVVTDWSQIPGSGVSGTIDPVGRDSNGGTYNYFLQAVLNNELQASNVNALTADGLVINAIQQDPDAIGYAALSWQSKKVKTLKVNGIACEAKTISVEPLKYPLSRYLFVVLPGNGKESPPALLKFLDWARTSKLAGEVIAAAGGVPAFNKK